MLFIKNPNINDPTLNLALEEYVLRHMPLEEGCLLFYINAPSIIIGKNQNTIEEINAEYVEQHNIKVVRRLSGGGAVYHDFGNLNYSFLTLDDGKSFSNFEKFTKPVTDTLRKLGVDAAFTGRNDIQVGDQKISGNAQFITSGRMYTHGTLLFNSDLQQVASALKVKPLKIESKSTKSVRSRVANITEFLSEPMTIEQFRDAIIEEVFKDKAITEVDLTQAQWDEVHALAESRYRQWDWNYGRSPKSNIEHAVKFPSGIIDVRLQVEEGRIQHIRLFGDYFGTYDVSELEDKLIGVKYDEVSVREAIASLQLKDYFGEITNDQFIQLIFQK